MSYPAASAALLHAVRDVAGIAVDTTSLDAASVDHSRRLDLLVSGNDDHLSMLRQLEAAYDAALTGDAGSGSGGPLPSGDDLAAEFERYLREGGS
jgi:hypothetical protein